MPSASPVHAAKPAIAHVHAEAQRKPRPHRAPTLSLAVTLDAPPSVGLPLGVNFDLSTRWQPIAAPTGSTAGIGLTSMSSDSTVWAGRGSSVLAYNPHTGVWQDVYDAPGRILSVAAGPVVSAGGQPTYTTYAVYSGSGNGINPAVRITYGPAGAVSVTPLPAPGSYVTLTQVAAGADGTVWGRGLFGNLYAYSASGGTWTRQPTGGLFVTQVSVGSAGNIWAIVGTPGPKNTTVASVYRVAAGGLKPEPAAPAGTVAVAATAGGTVWALTSGNALYQRPAGQSAWVAVADQTPPAGIAAFAATSRYRAVAITAAGLDLLTFGLADQPPTGYAAWTAGQSAAYAYLNQQLGITAPGGVRFEYTNQFAVNDLPIYQSLILTMAAPSGVKASDWQAVRSRILSEISSVLAVYQVYNEIDSLDNFVAFRASTLLTEVDTLVSLTSDQQKSGFTFSFQQLLSAALGGIAKAITGGAGVAASVIASGLSSAVADLTGGSSQGIQSSYLLLQQQLDTIFTQAEVDNSNDKAAILSDPGRFLPVGAGINDGTLYWPLGSNRTLAQSADAAFETYFLQVLAPVRFSIMKITDYPEFDLKQIPAYDQYYVPNGETEYGTLYTLAAGSYAFPEYPVASLIQTIVGLTQVSVPDLLTNKLGWFRVATFEYDNGVSPS